MIKARGKRKKAATGGFEEDGRRYVLRDVGAIANADSDLWNDHLTVRVGHRGQCKAAFTQPDNSQYAGDVRCFYLRDDETGRFCSLPHDPVGRRPRSFEFSIGLADIRWRVKALGLEAEVRVVVPRTGIVELWEVAVCNPGKKRRKVSLYSFVPFNCGGKRWHNARFVPGLNGVVDESFPAYLDHEDYPALAQLNNVAFCLADRKPTAYEASLLDFVGEGDLTNPDQLGRRRLRGGVANDAPQSDPSAGVLQFTRTLRPGTGLNVSFAIGATHDVGEARRIRTKHLKPGGVARAQAQQEAFLKKHSPAVRIETPDSDFDAFVNHWLPRRTMLMIHTHRMCLAPQGRNAIQDAMGAAYSDPERARYWFTKYWRDQKSDGWMPHGLSIVPGAKHHPINSIPHRDINVWGPMALHFYVAETGDASLLDERVCFADRPRKRASVYEHICLGLDWLLRDSTSRGLSRIGKGDWNDVLNGAGIKGKGESVWLTEALVYALECWADVAQWRGDTRRAARYRRQARRSRQAVARIAWDGKWFIRGTTDAGRRFGSSRDRQGKIYLNAQSWALISGAANEARADKCIRSVERHLMSPSGPTTLAPAFTSVEHDIGMLSMKPAGSSENGSVYCHAATFYAYALYVARRKDKAFEALRVLLTGDGGNTIERSGQLPLYVPNAFRGPAAGRRAGLSSHSMNTGTAPWYYRTAITMLMGVRAELEGLRIDPQLPSKWRKARVWRRWRGAEFDIRIVTSDKAARTTVVLNGEPLPDGLVPVQRSGSRHVVEVTVAR